MTPHDAHAIATKYNAHHPPAEQLYRHILRKIAAAAAHGRFHVYDPEADFLGDPKHGEFGLVTRRLRREGYTVTGPPINSGVTIEWREPLSPSDANAMEGMTLREREAYLSAIRRHAIQGVENSPPQNAQTAADLGRLLEGQTLQQATTAPARVSHFDGNGINGY